MDTIRIRSDTETMEISVFSFSLNLDDFRPFVAAFDMYARGNSTDNKPMVTMRCISSLWQEKI